MRLSLHEIEQTVMKAAAGRELDHGVAAELGAAARWMCEHGLDGITAAHRALAADDRSPDALGLTAVDRELCGESPEPDGATPPLLVGLRGRAGLAPETTAGRHAGRETDPAWAAICAWAALTSVPSSDRSRASGAGAGLTDND